MTISIPNYRYSCPFCKKEHFDYRSFSACCPVFDNDSMLMVKPAAGETAESRYFQTRIAELERENAKLKAVIRDSSSPSDSIKEQRVVVCAAIEITDKHIFSVERPWGHLHLFLAGDSLGITAALKNRPQGFLLSDGTFADRETAEKIARASGQLKGSLIGSHLTSEDLW